MNRRNFTQSLVLVSGSCAAFPVLAKKGVKRPNLVYIFADQMRFSAMSCMAGVPGAGREPEALKTPVMDGLASEGILFTHAFSTTPVCSPHRVGLQTGQYCNRVGYSLDPKEKTIGQVLKAQGYATGFIGKWHMHGSVGKPKGFVEPDRRTGWDYFAGHECTHKYFKTVYFKNDDRTPIPIQDGAYEPEVQTELAMHFMRRQTPDKPFCLFLSWGPPHNPYRPPKAFDTHKPEDVPLRPNVAEERKNAAAENLAKYYGQVESLDELLGRLLATLKEQGLEKNTIVCFSSDHGDMHQSQMHTPDGRGGGYKRRPFEESVRIPFVMRWPKKIKPGQRRDMLFGSVNYMPTLLGLCGAPIPERVQGEDLSGAILEDKPGPDSVFLQQTVGGNSPHRSPWRAIRTATHMYATSGYTKNGGWLLYDLQKDPYQMNNLVDDPAHAKMRKELEGRLKAWRDKTEDTQDMYAAYLKASQGRPNKKKSKKG